MKLPRYPVYVPTKGRAHAPLTIDFLKRDGVPFRAVVEREEAAAYEPLVGTERLLVLPESGGGLIYARNWIMEHSISEGHERHWQLDDNMSGVWRVYRGRRIRCIAGPGLAACEDFTDRYSNIALSGLGYMMFAFRWEPAVVRNVHVYSCTLVNNAIPYRWRLVYNDDTDICLQVLAGGWCTALIHAFCVEKRRTMTVKGGNTDDLYQGDGRLTMARSLERMWPGVVRTKRRYGRPQHRINWLKFDTPLALKEGTDLSALVPDEYGLRLHAKREIRSPELRRFYDEANA